MKMVKVGNATLYHGNCLDVLPLLDPVDAVVADPPYETTTLAWDKAVDGWIELLPTNVLWCFGSFRSLSAINMPPDWCYSQEIVWEKHNGSNFHNDRFRRVHELAVMHYRGAWKDLYHDVPVTMDARKKYVKRKAKPNHHLGACESSVYVSEEGGARKMRSVIYARSCHGYAVHPTQKPVEILSPLISYSCPPGGVVLDPFMGSGSAGVAAIDIGRKFVGIEKDPHHFESACERLKQCQRQTRLFS